MTVSPGRIFGEFIIFKKSKNEEEEAFDIIMYTFGFPQSYIFRVIASPYNIYASTKSVMRCVWFTLWVWFFRPCAKFVLLTYWNCCSLQSQDACFAKCSKNHCEKRRHTEWRRKKKVPRTQPSIICLMTFTSSATFSISWQTLFKVYAFRVRYTFFVSCARAQWLINALLVSSILKFWL